MPRLFADHRLFSGYSITLPFAIYALCRSKSWLSRFFCAAPFLLLGEISYSLYLLHGNLFPIFRVKFLGDFTAQTPEMLIKSACFLAILFPVSWLMYRYLEMPARIMVMNFYRNSIRREAVGA